MPQPDQIAAPRATPQDLPLDRATVLNVLLVYQQAWEARDPEQILTIFTEDATYQERAFQEPARGHEGIRRYWQEKVVKGQARIQFSLLNLYLDGATAIAEWEAEFDDVPARTRRRMREVAILEFRAGKIDSLREYWYAVKASQ